jgi:hypothetical protein
MVSSIVRMVSTIVRMVSTIVRMVSSIVRMASSIVRMVDPVDACFAEFGKTVALQALHFAEFFFEAGYFSVEPDDFAGLKFGYFAPRADGRFHGCTHVLQLYAFGFGATHSQAGQEAACAGEQADEKGGVHDVMKSEE